MSEVAAGTPEAAPRGSGAPEGPGAVTTADAEIVDRISAAVHEPFAEAWRRYDQEAWLPLRRALEGAVAAHEQALADAAGAHERALGALAVEGMEDAGSGYGERERLEGDGGREARAGDSRQDASGAPARYRDAVSDEVIEPLRAVLARSGGATTLERSLTSAADDARAALAQLPAILQAPASRSSAVRVSGVGAIRGVKRAVARALGPVVWRGRMRRVPVTRLARQHLDQVMLRAQASAFRQSQCDRAERLGHLERACSEWAAAVLRPVRAADAPEQSADPAEEQPPDEARIHQAAGAALQAELQALTDEVERACASSRSADFRRLEELLAASVAVAGTFAADPPSSRPRAGLQPELPAQWDAWAREAAARLELYRSLVAMRRGVDGILGELRSGWSRIVRNADAVLADVVGKLGRGRERAEKLSAAEADLPAMLEAERQRTDRALALVQGSLPEPEAVFEALTGTVEEGIRALDQVRERMPGALALHDIPAPGDVPRKPGADPRTVRVRETFLHAFDLLRRERMRAAPSPIREAMRRAHLEVAELREVSGYGYEAAVAEVEDRRDPDAPHPTALVANGLVRAANKAAAARQLLRDSHAAAEDKVAAEIGGGSRRLIEQVTADRMTAGYLEARTVLATAFARMWKRTQWLSAQVGARAAAAASWLLALLRQLRASLGLGPAPQAAAGRREHSLAHAEAYPRALPVVYRRLFSLEPLTDGRLLAGREDALAAVASAWSRCTTGEPRSLVVIASPGAGVTSFLNVVASRLSEVAPGGVRRTFATRVRAEARLAECLAGWLGLEEASDLDSLAERVLKAPPGSIPGFVILEATEHLHMRAPAGSRLFERLLTFMSRTESRVFWIAGMNSSAWQLVETRAPAFVHDIERVNLGELSPEALKQAVLARHRLSGLPLRFAEPHDGRAALRRRTRRLRGAEKQERLVEADYFQRLHRASRGSVRLALFHWLRTADFTSTPGSLLVQPLSMLDSGIENLDRTQSFALKAILDHGTLTVDDYCKVARTAGPESLHILRSLEECRVIERVGDVIERVAEAVPEKPAAEKAAGDGAARSRYRIRPLMIGPVTAHLRSRNILH